MKTTRNHIHATFLPFLVILALGTIAVGAADAPAKKGQDDFTQTEEYKNLTAIVDAYRNNTPGKVAELQTEMGRDVASYVAGISWLSKLPPPQLRNWKPFGQNESELLFVFDCPGSSNGLRVVVKFWLHNGKRCLNDIYLPDDPFHTSVWPLVWGNKQLAQPPFVGILSSLRRSVTAVTSQTTDYSEMSKALSDFQIVAVALDYSNRPEVTNFVSAATDMISFATRWDQTYKVATSKSVLDQMTQRFEASLEAHLSKLSAGISAESKTELVKNLKEELSKQTEMTIRALTLEQSEEFKRRAMRLRDASKGVLELAEIRSGLRKQ